MIRFLTNVIGVYMEINDDASQYRAISVVISITAEMNRELSLAAMRSGRSKSGEARLRLEDHLSNFTDIACAGKRFDNQGNWERYWALEPFTATGLKDETSLNVGIISTGVDS